MVDIGIVVKVGQWVQVLLWRSLVRAFIDRTGIAIPTNGRNNNDTTWYFVFFCQMTEKVDIPPILLHCYLHLHLKNICFLLGRDSSIQCASSFARKLGMAEMTYPNDFPGNTSSQMQGESSWFPTLTVTIEWQINKKPFSLLMTVLISECRKQVLFHKYLFLTNASKFEYHGYCFACPATSTVTLLWMPAL